MSVFPLLLWRKRSFHQSPWKYRAYKTDLGVSCRARILCDVDTKTSCDAPATGDNAGALVRRSVLALKSRRRDDDVRRRRLSVYAKPSSRYFVLSRASFVTNGGETDVTPAPFCSILAYNRGYDWHSIKDFSRMTCAHAAQPLLGRNGRIFFFLALDDAAAGAVVESL